MTSTSFLFGLRNGYSERTVGLWNDEQNSGDSMGAYICTISIAGRDYQLPCQTPWARERQNHVPRFDGLHTPPTTISPRIILLIAPQKLALVPDLTCPVLHAPQPVNLGPQTTLLSGRIPTFAGWTGFL
jgi:hypothetical protein